MRFRNRTFVNTAHLKFIPSQRTLPSRTSIQDATWSWTRQPCLPTSATWVTRPSAEFGRFRGAKESLHERMRHAGNNLGAGGGGAGRREAVEGGGDKISMRTMRQ